jgi:hypothetical protein
MAGERYEHLFVSGVESTHGFTNPIQGRDSREFPVRNRSEHATYLKERLDSAWRQADQSASAIVETTRKGTYIEFASVPGSPLKFESLEYRPSGIRLCNVREEVRDNKVQTLATVYVPNAKRNYFLKRLDAYAAAPEGEKVRNEPLFRSIADVRRAVLDSFWRVDERGEIPGDTPEWIEVWLRTESDEEIAAFRDILASLEIPTLRETLHFPERVVLLAQANGLQLGMLIERSDLIVEFRVAKRVATFFIEMENKDQAAEVRALLDRVRFDGNSDVAVCVLDSGVNRGHPLLTLVLDPSDMHAFDPLWGTHDDGGHGTLMAGSATYGDLLAQLNGTSLTRIRHRLESAKIIPPPPATNPKRLWGHVTSQGVSRAEIQAPNRKRVVCLAVTSIEDRDQGRPSSWSAAIDALASGYGEETKRLIVVSAGNVRDSDCWRNYPADNLTNEVHDPGQSWNALTVGAFTEKVCITDPTLAGYNPIANAGSLSPHSTTSTTWERRRWPIKPEVVFEGGNIALGPNGSVETETLGLLSTSHEPHLAHFAPFCATSAAAAQASWMAAQIHSAYPQAWPETVRGLLVHSARWTDALKSEFMRGQSAKKGLDNLLRVCGYGVPTLERSLYSLADNLTLIAQSVLQPFHKRVKVKDGRKETTFATKDMHLYELPWPTEELAALGAVEVTMRVTLSYFVEPGPGEVGWDYRYRYASHALRFDVNRPLETEATFMQRVNKKARDENDGQLESSGTSDKWDIGPTIRNVGSIHSDVWRGTAIDLAASNFVAVYPTTGWWKERNHLNRWDSQCRYSLIVSIETPELEQEINIYIPVAAQVGIPIPIPIADGTPFGKN